MQVETGFAAINDTHLYYEVAGSGPPVVLIHGFTLDTRAWDDQFAPLAADFRVVRYDMRGFGQSPPPDGTPYHDADDLRALLAYLGIEAAAIVGLSQGGGVAIEFALAYPAMTTALVVIGSLIAGHRWSADWDDEVTPVWQGARQEGIPTGKARWLAHSLFAPTSEQPAVRARLEQMVQDYSGWHWVNRDPARRAAVPAIDRLAEIASPTLVIVGERDLPDFQEMARRLHHDIPHCQFLVLPDVGHLTNMEAPAAVNHALQGFLAQLQ